MDLRGDAQRLASQWKAAGWISNGDQAYAAAGMSILTGFSSPSYRTLDSQQSQNAEIAGYQLLGDAFNAPHADQTQSTLSQNESLNAKCPISERLKSIVEHANLTDPRHEAEGVSHRAQGKFIPQGKVASGEQAIIGSS